MQISTSTRLIEADVVVIGGGVSGLFAAIACCEEGARVVVVDKADARRSGDAGAGNDHFNTYLNAGEPWDTRDEFLNWYLRLGEGMINPEAAEANVTVLPEVVERLTAWGVPLHDREGNYIRTRSFNQTAAYSVNFDGREIKTKLYQQAKKQGAIIVNHVHVHDLLMQNGLAGAVGFSVASGNCCEFHAPVIILSTGDATRLWQNPSGNPFNTWNSPYNTGTGLRLAWEAGAQLANMEFSVSTITPKNFSAAGLNAFISMGAHLLNGLGERYMERYHAGKEAAPRWLLVWGTMREYMAGRGPCYFDCRHLSDDDMSHLINHLLPVDKATFLDFINQKGIDLRHDLLELQVSEMQWGGYTGKPGGILVDKDYRTSVPNLFSAGANSTPCYALSGACCTGWVAGRAAGREAGKALRCKVSADEVLARHRSVMVHLKDGPGPNWREVEDKVRQVMSDYVGLGRTRNGLETALQKLDILEQKAKDVRISDYHALLRTLECLDLITVGKIICHGALAREESRHGAEHFRGDFPEISPELKAATVIWKQLGVVHKKIQRWV